MLPLPKRMLESIFGRMAVVAIISRKDTFPRRQHMWVQSLCITTIRNKFPVTVTK